MAIIKGKAPKGGELSNMLHEQEQQLNYTSSNQDGVPYTNTNAQNEDKYLSLEPKPNEDVENPAEQEQDSSGVLKANSYSNCDTVESSSDAINKSKVLPVCSSVSRNKNVGCSKTKVLIEASSSGTNELGLQATDKTVNIDHGTTNEEGDHVDHYDEGSSNISGGDKEPNSFRMCGNQEEYHSKLKRNHLVCEAVAGNTAVTGEVAVAGDTNGALWLDHSISDCKLPMPLAIPTGHTHTSDILPEENTDENVSAKPQEEELSNCVGGQQMILGDHGYEDHNNDGNKNNQSGQEIDIEEEDMDYLHVLCVDHIVPINFGLCMYIEFIGEENIGEQDGNVTEQPLDEMYSIDWDMEILMNDIYPIGVQMETEGNFSYYGDGGDEPPIFNIYE